MLMLMVMVKAACVYDLIDLVAVFSSEKKLKIFIAVLQSVNHSLIQSLIQ